MTEMGLMTEVTSTSTHAFRMLHVAAHNDAIRWTAALEHSPDHRMSIRYTVRRLRMVVSLPDDP